MKVMAGAGHSALAALQDIVEPGGIIFLHGLESGPRGNKSRWLQENISAFAVDLDTTAARALRLTAQAQGLDYGPDNPAFERAFSTPMARARRALRDHPAKVLVGSSFGGAVLLKLIHEGSWTGPSVFVAQAGIKLTEYRALPDDIPAILLHGLNDMEIPIAHSRMLAENSGPMVQLWEIDDGHRMHSILDNGMLATAILASINLSTI
ncbi:MAG TPA: hypothetical protein EYN66_16840 [Myxococcales bacterium]|nr:hypothetical protein [Myxococcales bacterium]